MQGEQGFADLVAAFYQLVDRMEAWRSGSEGDMPYPVNLNAHARCVQIDEAANRRLVAEELAAEALVYDDDVAPGDMISGGKPTAVDGVKIEDVEEFRADAQQCHLALIGWH